MKVNVDAFRISEEPRACARVGHPSFIRGDVVGGLREYASELGQLPKSKQACD